MTDCLPRPVHTGSNLIGIGRCGRRGGLRGSKAGRLCSGPSSCALFSLPRRPDLAGLQGTPERGVKRPGDPLITEEGPSKKSENKTVNLDDLMSE
jgi:hypothetical protein